MKKLFIPLALMLSLMACNNEEPAPVLESATENEAIETLRTEEDAIKIATKALNDFYPVQSRSARDLSNMNVVLLKNDMARGTDTTNPLYVVNFGNESGYAIVAADKDVSPLLAVTEAGSITDLNNIDNPGVKLFVNNAMKLKRDSNFVPITPIDTTFHKVNIYRNDTVYNIIRTVESRTSVEWAQDYPEGIYCPNGKSGCGPTAGAIALSYFEYPQTLTLSFDGRPYDQTNLNWDEMKLINGYSNNIFFFSEYDRQLALLCREIGEKAGVTYELGGGTSTSVYNMRDFFNDFLPKDKFTVTDFAAGNPQTNELLGNGIIVIGADESYPKEENAPGHIWVIDGYKYLEYTVYVYYHEQDSPIEHLERQFINKDLYSSVNWGARGKHNGYFFNNVFHFDDKYFTTKIYYFTIKTK